MAIIEISVSRRGKGVQVQTRMLRNDDDSELVRNTAKRIHMSLGGFIHGLVVRIFAKVENISPSPADKNNIH
ncbi:hypothetical protein BUE65_21030 [Klebsiella variicola]|uniref:hypothetical protein n=1 Tax=Klebsiella variicola TaxID=244366 RepID=UPI000B52E939|nr:hypothetical protein [Klebsiella variicola]OWW14045.1 hypothetical protein BUE65_21030 [Klebsiella variicola]HCB0898968.1 hypothetical protein [Klebsiella variicola subsp. variicola]HCB4011301.1 hypothetical protein [Klebsiella variicola subsp. variicola]HDT1813228.1 hypothetical protein [Klebsiella variicola]